MRTFVVSGSGGPTVSVPWSAVVAALATRAGCLGAHPPRHRGPGPAWNALLAWDAAFLDDLGRHPPPGADP